MKIKINKIETTWDSIWLFCKIMSYWFPDKPSKPTLQASKTNPTDGSPLTLTCAPTNAAVTKYEFYKDGRVLSGASKSNVYTIKTTTFSNKGSYTCKASIDTAASDTSSAIAVTSKCCFINIH